MKKPKKFPGPKQVQENSSNKVLVAYVISDLHIGEYTKFSTRTDTAFNVLHKVGTLGGGDKFYNLPIIHCGDLFHSSDKLTASLANKVIDNFIKLREENVRIISITGNHGSPLTHKIGDSNSLLSYDQVINKVFSKTLQIIDFKFIDLTDTIRIYGVPYIDHNNGLNDYLKNIEISKDKKNILMLHTDYPGAKDTDGREVGSVENLNINLLNRFDLVLCGHIHKPQRLSKKVYMIGAPYQQRRTDAKCKMGYWELYNDLSIKFVPIKGNPRFIDVESPDEIKDDGNYYTVIPKVTRVKSSSEHKITKQLSKRSLARHYMREKGIKDKKKTNLLINLLKRTETC